MIPLNWLSGISGAGENKSRMSIKYQGVDVSSLDANTSSSNSEGMTKVALPDATLQFFRCRGSSSCKFNLMESKVLIFLSNLRVFCGESGSGGI